MIIRVLLDTSDFVLSNSIAVPLESDYQTIYRVLSRIPVIA